MKAPVMVPAGSEQRPTRRFQYWYIVLFVHILVTVFTFATAYFLTVGGIDISALLGKLSLDRKMVEKMEMSRLGPFAMGVLFTKLMTPIRYALTMASSTIFIKRIQNSVIAT